jgi:ParB/RepB/Spo0J family partition protein
MIATLPLDAIRPNPGQPRRHFDAAALGELADSIKAVGLLEPIIVRGVPSAGGMAGHYQIIAGERRWRAASMAGLDRVPVIHRDGVDDLAAFELSMIENVIRQDMNPIEEAEGYGQLIERGLDVETIATRIGKSAASIRSRLTLLRLDPPIRELVRVGQMDAYDASHLSRLSTEGQYRVVSAMRDGLLSRPNDVVRFVGTLYAQESQVDMFAEAEVETVAPERIKAQHGLRETLTHALEALTRAHALIDAGALVVGLNIEEVARQGEAIEREAKRVARRADGARLEATAKQLGMEAIA